MNTIKETYQSTIFDLMHLNSKKCCESEEKKNNLIYNVKSFKKSLFSLIKNIFDESRIFFRNTSYIVIFSLFLLCFFSIISVFVYARTSVYFLPNPRKFFNMEKCTVNTKHVLTAIFIAYFHSIFLALVLSLLTCISSTAIISFFFISEKNWESKIKNALCFISEIINGNMFVRVFIIFHFFSNNNFQELITVFFFTETIAKLSVINSLIESKSKLKFIKYNLVFGVHKQHVLFKNIFPHCKVELVDLFIDIFKSYVYFIDVLPSVARNFMEVKMKSFYTFIYLLSLSLNNLSINHNDLSMLLPTNLSIILLIFVILNFILVSMLIFHIKKYIILKYGYEKND